MNESTNFGLKTTGDNDQWRNTLDYHNENMGVIDAVLAKNQDALGIIVDGNKAAVSATTGQYIILRNSTISGKTDGLYNAAKSIPANTAIDGTYLTAVSGGGLNALNSNLSNNVFQEIAPTGTRCTVVSGGVAVVGNLAVINVKIHSAYSATNTPSMLSVNVRTPKCVTALSCVKSGTTQGSMSGAIACHIGTNKQVYVQSVENDAYYDISGVVVLA